MARKGQSFYIESHGPNDAALVRGMQWLVQNAAQKSGTSIVIVYALKNLENLSWSTCANIFRALAERRSVKTNDVTLQLVTVRDNNVYRFDGPILVLHGGDKVLDLADGIEGTADLLLIPWNRSEAQSWIDTWQATPLDQPKPAPTESALSAVAQSALLGLTARVNLATGIINSSDKEAAIETLETLLHKNVGASPELIRQELVRLHRDPKYARDVKALPEMIWEGRRPRGASGKANDALWTSWQKDASKNDLKTG